jgi:hypothetical protein
VLDGHENRKLDLLKFDRFTHGPEARVTMELLMFVGVNVIIAWLGIAAGIAVGAVNGLFFHDDRWLGGYGSWPRRMLRLGHIAFFGLALLNLAYAVTIQSLGWPAPPVAVSWTLAAATGLMPLVCFLAAWHKPLRHLFVLPVCCVLTGVIGLLVSRALS